MLDVTHDLLPWRVLAPFAATAARHGSVARGTAHKESDVDFLVQPPRGAQIRDLVEFRDLLGEVLGREVDVITYGALKPELDSDIRREAVLL